MEEKIFYQNAGITVTNSRYITHTRTYALRNISSVYTGVIKPNRLISIILVFAGLLMCFSGNSNTNILVFGIAVLLIGIIWLALQKTKYTVAISSNAGESKSIISKDQFFVQTIVSALNEAITHTVTSTPNQIPSVSFTNHSMPAKIDEMTTSFIQVEQSEIRKLPVSSNHDEKITKLKELKELLDSDILTKPEFDQLKSQIL